MCVVNMVRNNPSRYQKQRANSLAKFFVDREYQRKIFKKHIADISDKESTVLSYSGVGGIGKTALIRELENFLITKSSIYKYIGYDFNGSSDMLTSLNALKKTLIDKYGVEFPLYEKGCIYYLQKRGDFVSYEHIQELFNKSSVLKKTLDKIDSAVQTINTAGNFVSIAKNAISITTNLFNVFYGVGSFSRIMQTGLRKLDEYLTERAQKAKEENDPSYGEIIRELEERNSQPQAESLKEYLPTLFARDISDWLKENNLKLIIFLDTYEALTGVGTNILHYERLVSINKDVPVDWWIEDLLTYTNRTLWVIAGRVEIKKIGEHFKIPEKSFFNLNALEKNFADKFLLESGIEDEKLRQGIFELTGGYPNYLSVCVDTYNEIKETGGNPTISDFGERRETIVYRLIDFMDADAQSMVKRLCILGLWTDDVAQKILVNLHEWNLNNYKRIKQLSFIFAQSAGTNSKKIICFDKSIQKILIEHLKINDVHFIEETRQAANEIFRNIFYSIGNNDDSFFEEDLLHLFRFWCEMILCTADESKTLMLQYAGNLSPLNHLFKDSITENVIKKFQDKVRQKDGTENIYFAYFEHLLAQIKLRQGRDTVALTYAEAAYRKFKDTHNVEKISVINTLAEVYKKLKRNAVGIELRKEAVKESENIFYYAYDEHIIEAKKNLAYALERVEKKNEAREIFKEILNSTERFNDERKLTALADYAHSLEQTHKYKEALKLREEIVDFYRNTTDKNALINSIKDLISVLKNFHVEEQLKEILHLQKELVTLYELTYGEYSQEVVEAHFDVFATLKNLNNALQAANEREMLAAKFKIRIKKSEIPKEKIYLIKNLIGILRNMQRYDEADRWKGKFQKLLRRVVTFETQEPVKDYESAVSSINDLINELNWSKNYREVVDMQRKILKLTKNNPDSTDEEIISAMQRLTNILVLKSEGYEEAFRLSEKIVENFKDKYSYDKTNSKILDAMNNVAVLLEKFTGDIYAALIKRQEIFQYLKINNASDKKILLAMEKIAELWAPYLDNYVEALNWRKKILDYCREKFPEGAPEIISAMENLAGAYENLDQYDKSEKLRAEIVEIRSKQVGDSVTSDVIDAKQNHADQLHNVGNYDSELKLRSQIVELCRKNHAANGGSRKHIIEALNNMAELLDKLELYQRAYEYRQQIIKELEQEHSEIVFELGKNSDDAVHKLESIAEAFRDIGDYEKELEYRQKILKLRQNYDETSVDTVYSLGKLAEFFADTDNEEEEFNIRAKIVEISKKVLDKCISGSVYGSDTILAMYRLMIAEKDFGNYDEVENLAEKILETRRNIVEKRKKIFGNNHQLTIAALEEFAEGMRNCGRYDEELVIRKEILKCVEEINDENEADILIAKNNIAYTLGCIKDFEGVLKIRKDILNFCIKQPNGDMSSQTLAAMNKLAIAYQNLSDYRAVLRIRSEILDICKQKYIGEDCNSDILNAMYNKACALEDLDKNDDALKILREIVELYAKMYGENGYSHDDTVNAMENIAQFLERRKNFDGAIKEREKIVAILRKKYPAGHEKVCSAMEKVARILESKGDYENALHWLKNILEVGGDFFKFNCAVANTLDNLDRHDKAQVIRKKIVDKLKEQLHGYIKIYGKNSDKVLKILEQLAANVGMIINTGSEILYYKLILKILMDFKGSSSEKFLKAMSKLAEAYDCEAESTSSIYREQIAEIQKKVLTFRIKHWGNEHSRTIDIREQLACTFEVIGQSDYATKLREENLKAMEIVMNRRIQRFTKSEEITLDAMRNYADCLKKLNLCEEAEEIHKRIVKIYEDKFVNDKTNQKIIDSLERFATLLESDASFNTAVIIRNRIIDLLKKKYPNHEFCDQIIKAMENLVHLHEIQKDFYAAVFVQNNIVELLEKRFGYENHNKIIRARNDLATLREMKPKIPSANLRKGQKISLTKNNSRLSEVVVNFRCDAPDNFKIDYYVYLLGKNGKVNFDEDIISAARPANGAVKVKYLENHAQILIDLPKIPKTVAKIEFAMTIFDNEQLRKNFSQIENAYISIADAKINEEILRFNVKQNLSDETAVIAGEIYRYNGDWKFAAIGSGFTGGIKPLNKNFGVTIN